MTVIDDGEYDVIQMMKIYA